MHRQILYYFRSPIHHRAIAPLFRTPFRTFTSTPTTLFTSSTRTLSNRTSPSPHTQFYSTFGRATLKVLSMAFLAYQVTYWAWIKVEHEEERYMKNGEVKRLEEEVRRMKGMKGKRLLEEEK